MKKYLHIDVFDTSIPVFTSDKARIKYIEKKGGNPQPINGKFRGAAPYDVVGDGGVIFSLILPKDAEISTWAHECVHVADLVMDYSGIPTGVKNTEIRAYIVGHLMDQLERLRK